jgi:hypothetical protein
MEWADKSGRHKTMAGSSVNFKAVKSASHAVSHASREVEPTYLLPEGKSLGTICLLDDKGMVASVLEAKMALASRQALRQGDYSPVWEGVINLRRPEQGEDAKAYKLECSKVISEWCTSYQNMTGHTVLRADIHLDEGHIVDGVALLNAHAHVICDKTNDKGRVLKVNAPDLRKIQDMTAKVTRLERGKSSLQTGRKHIDHQAYKYLAERGRLEVQQVVGQLDKSQGDLTRLKKLSKEWSDADLAKVKGLGEKLASVQLVADKVPQLEATIAQQTLVIGNLLINEDVVHKHRVSQGQEIAQLKAKYDQDRATLKASGEATQRAYQALKAAHEGALAELKKSNQKAEKMEKQITQLTEENTKLAADKAKFATMATAYQAEKAAGKDPALFVPGAAPAPMPSTSNLTPDPGLPAFLAKHKDMPLAAAGDLRYGVVKESCGSYALLSLGRGRHVIHDFGTVQAVPQIGTSSDKPGPGNQR